MEGHMLRRIQHAILALALVSVHACSGNSSSTTTSPTSPSSGAIVTGVVANGSASTQSASLSGAHVMAVAGVQRVEVVGTNISSGIDNEGRFSLAGVPDGSVVLRFSGTGVNATVNI